MRAPRRRRGQRGQALVVLALLSTVLFGFAAVGIDLGVAMDDRRNLQVDVDTAALAASHSISGGTDQGDYVALQYLAKQLGFTISSLSSQGCSSASTCPAGTYTSGTYTITLTVSGTTLDVTISHSRRTLLASLLGFSTVVDGSGARSAATTSAQGGPAILGLRTSCVGNPPRSTSQAAPM